MNILNIFCICFFVLLSSVGIFCQSDNYWTFENEDKLITTEKNIGNRNQNIPEIGNGVAFSLDFADFKNTLRTASLEGNTSSLVLPFPLPNGDFEYFEIWKSSIMESGLAEKYPDIQSYILRGVSDKSNVGRMTVSSSGVHAFVTTPRGQEAFYIDQLFSESTKYHYAYYGKALGAIFDEVRNHSHDDIVGRFQDFKQQRLEKSSPNAVGTTLRQFRIAMTIPGELSQQQGWTDKATALVGVVNFLGDINTIYERDLSIRFLLVNDNDDLIFLDPTTDPFTVTGSSAIINENQQATDSAIGNSNYDFGLVLVTGDCCGTLLAIACDDSNKAKNYSRFAALFTTCHEIGHQFSANHTWNSCNAGTGGQYVAGAAHEVGSGTTIMSYHGICDTDNIPNPGDLTYFSVGSFTEITNFVSTLTCQTTTPTGNTPPTINLPSGGFYIPKGTPFTLQGTASDPDGDNLTYSWEQYNIGPHVTLGSQSGNSPAFRNFNPTTSPSRTFPNPEDLVNNINSPSELLADASRDYTFRLFVRDNRAGGGGADYEEIAFHADGNSGPFLVTSPNGGTEVWAPGSTQTVTWDVANTAVAPVSCANVNILLSSDGGYTFSETLASNVPNDGSHDITVPDICNTTIRIKVECADNIFFDISNQDFSITTAVGRVTYDNLTNESVEINWEGLNSAPFDLEWGETGFQNGNGTLVSNINATTYSLSSLQDTTSYDVFVRIAGGSSCWVGPLSFKTLLCDPLSIPYEENFENGGLLPTCWIQSKDDKSDWTVSSGSTSTNGSGPTSAQDGSYYVYYEASGKLSSDTAILIGPPMDLRSIPTVEISFYYHMYGINNGIGDLILEVESPAGSGNWVEAWRLSGDQGNSWQQAVVDISAYANQVIGFRFVTFANNPPWSDIAIDLIKIESCSDLPTDPRAIEGDQSATLTWNSGGSSSFDIEWGNEGFSSGTGTVISSVADTFQLLTNLTNGQSYDYFVRGNCNGGVSSWVGPYTFTPNPPITAPYLEDFEDESIPNLPIGWLEDLPYDQSADGWQVHTGTTPSSQSGDTGPSGAHSGSQYVYFEASGNPKSKIGYLITPTIDLEMISDPVFSFYYHMNGGSIGTLKVDVQIPGESSSWTTLWSITGDQQAKNDPFVQRSIDLSAYNGKIIKLRFCLNTSDTFGDAAIDFIQLESCAAPPTNQLAIELDQAATLFWTSGGSNAFEVEWGNKGFSQGSGTLISSVVDTFYNLTGLNNAQSYDYFVRGDCDGSDSDWVGPYTFTPSPQISVPFLEDFEDESIPNLPAGWSEDLPYDQSADGWQVHTGTTPSSQSGDTGPSGAHSGSQYVYFEASGDPKSKIGYLITPTIDLEMVSSPVFSFYYHLNGGSIGTLKVDVQVLGESTAWTTLWSITGDQQAKNDSFIKQSIDLSAYTGKFIRLRFCLNTSDTFGDAAIDLIQLESCAAPPTNQFAIELDQAAVLTWSSGGSNTFDIEWGNEGFSQGAGTMISSVMDTSYNLGGLSNAQSYDYYLRANCDGTYSNWSGPYTFSPCPHLTFPFVEDFEDETIPNLPDCWLEDLPYNQSADGWQVHTSTTPSSFTVNTGPSGAHSGSQYVYFEASGDPKSKTGNLITPTIDLTMATGPNFSFHYHMNGWSIGTLKVDIQVLGESTSWTTLWSISGDQHERNDPFSEQSIDLSAYTGKYVKLRFSLNTTDSSGDVALDLIQISSCSAAPTNQLAIELDQAATLIWTSGGANKFDIEWGNESFSQGSGTLISSVVDTFYNLSGLTNGQTYAYYVRGNCDDTFTNWVGPYTFTPNTQLSVPFLEDFEDETIPFLPAGWSEDLPYNQSADGWQVHTGTTPTLSFGDTGPSGAHSGSQYVYFEASGDPKSKVGYLITPIIDLEMAISPALSFHYHMNGSSIGTLKVDVQIPGESSSWRTLWSISGDQQGLNDAYIRKLIDLSAYEGKLIKLRFCLSTFDSFADVALDDIAVETGVVTIPEEIGQALVFDGIDDLVTISNESNFDLTTATMELWVKANSFDASNKWISKQNLMSESFSLGSSSNAVELKLNDSKKLVAGTLNTGEWYHVAGVIEDMGGTTNLILYVNGEQVGTTSVAGSANLTDAAVVLGNFSNEWFDGTMDEIRIWDDVRTIEEIRANIHKRLTGSEDGLVAYYSFDNVMTTNGTANEILDATSNGNHGTGAGMDNNAIVTSDAAIGVANVYSVTGVTAGPQTLGNITFNFSDAFDNSQDIYVTEILTDPNSMDGVVQTNQLKNRYFVIEIYDNGGTAGTFSTNLTFTLPDGNIAPGDAAQPSGLYLYRRDSYETGNWTNIATGSSATSTTVTFNGISGFSQFSIASNISLLPVEIIYLEGNLTTKGVQLNWETASELNNQGFQIERSTNAKDWLMLGFVKGNGTTLQPQTYTYLDEQPKEGFNYYRLKQVDFDGSYSHSSIVSVNYESNVQKQYLKIYPNPATNVLFYEVANMEEVQQIVLLDLYGKLIKTNNIIDGTFSLSNVESGIYLLVVQTTKGKMIQRVVKQ